MTPTEDPSAVSQDHQGPSPFVILGLVLLLIGGGYLLLSKMSEARRLEDCVLTGHRNCVPVTESVDR